MPHKCTHVSKGLAVAFFVPCDMTINETVSYSEIRSKIEQHIGRGETWSISGHSECGTLDKFTDKEVAEHCGVDKLLSTVTESLLIAP